MLISHSGVSSSNTSCPLHPVATSQLSTFRPLLSKRPAGGGHVICKMNQILVILCVRKLRVVACSQPDLESSEKPRYVP